MGKLRLVLRVATLGALLFLPALVLADTTNTITLQATVTVSIATNITETEVEWQPAFVPQWQQAGESIIVNRTQGPAKAKVLSTNVFELTTLTFDWQGEVHTIRTVGRTITNTATLWRLQSEWKPTTEPPKEPDPIRQQTYPGILIIK